MSTGDDWQSTPTSKPHVTHPKPPRITPPPSFPDHQPPAAPDKVSSSLIEDLFGSAALQNQKPNVVLPTGFDSSHPRPIPSCSPEVKRFSEMEGRCALAQNLTASAQAHCHQSTESRLECLPWAESSVTPSPAHHPARRCRATSQPPTMDESMKLTQSRVRAFPTLMLDTEDLAGAALHERSHRAHISTRCGFHLVSMSSSKVTIHRLDYHSRQSL